MVNQSKESRSTLESILKAGRFLVGAATLAIAGGCTASGHYEATPEARARVRRVVEQQDYKASLEDVSKKNFSAEALDPKNAPGSYNTPEALDKAVDDAAKNGVFAATGSEVATYNSIKEQNKLLNELVKTANVRRTVVTDMKKNVEYDALAYEPISKSELLSIDYNLRKLRTEVEKASYAGRQSLQTKLAGNKELQEMLKWNAEMLEGIAQLAIARADINQHEFYLNVINENEMLAGAIRKSTTGADVYADGEKAWKKLANEFVKDVVDPESPVAQEYPKMGRMKVSDLYEAIKGKIREEAADFGRHSKHTIGQFHYFHAKSILDQAHAINALTDAEVASAEKYLTADIANTVGSNIPDEVSPNVLERLASMLPIWQFYVAFRSAGTAFSKDSAYAANLVQMLEDGAVQRYGAGTGKNFKGSTTDDIWDFALSTGSIVAEGVGTYLILNKRKSSSSSSSSPATQSFGDDGITPGTGPR